MAHHHDFKIASNNVEYLEPQRIQNTLGRKRDESRSLHGLLEHAEEEFQLSLAEDGDQAFGIHNEITPQEPIEPEETQVGNMRRVRANISGSQALSRLGVPDLGGDRQPTLPELDESRQPVEKLDFEFLLQDLKGDDTAGAVAVASLSDGETTTDYHFTLKAPADNLRQTREFTWDNGRVVPAHSWWCRFVDCTRNSGCGWDTVYRCWEGSWTGFLWCMIRRCGWEVTKCAACATCDCDWWCKWAAGCCQC